jgi:RNA polymerase sigma factor (TIGR02999 family)
LAFLSVPLNVKQSKSVALPITDWLRRWSRGELEAEARVLPVVYDELHRIAEGVFRWEFPGHTLQPTAVLHEAYLRLTHQARLDWRSRKHFYSIAARLMRQVVTDWARRRLRHKRGGGLQRVTWGDAAQVDDLEAAEVLAVHEALETLALEDLRRAEIVELRFFGGLTAQETADELGCSRATVDREWRCARAWLAMELGGGRADVS